MDDPQPIHLRCRNELAASLLVDDGSMSKILRGVAAGWGAKKLGGGCVSTVLVFLLLWWLLGNFEIFQ